MDIIMRNSSGIYLVPEKTRLLCERKLYIEGEINDDNAMSFVRQLDLLNLDDRENSISIYINSPGGEVNPGLMIYDAIQVSTSPVKTFVMGKAFSMAALIACCADAGRYILPHSRMMIHEPLISHVSGNFASVKEISSHLMETEKEFNLLLAKHTGKSVEEIEKAASFDNFMNAGECVKFGLVDEIVPFKTISGTV